jgi:hypothetical protein
MENGLLAALLLPAPAGVLPACRGFQTERPMTADEFALAAQWNKNGQEGDALTYSIELFEVSDKTTCAKVTAVWGQDYVPLTQEGDSWRIHDVLWQSASTANTNR